MFVTGRPTVGHECAQFEAGAAPLWATHCGSRGRPVRCRRRRPSGRPTVGHGHAQFRERPLQGMRRAASARPTVGHEKPPGERLAGSRAGRGWGWRKPLHGTMLSKIIFNNRRVDHRTGVESNECEDHAYEDRDQRVRCLARVCPSASSPTSGVGRVIACRPAHPPTRCTPSS